MTIDTHYIYGIIRDIRRKELKAKENNKEVWLLSWNSAVNANENGEEAFETVKELKGRINELLFEIYSPEWGVCKATRCPCCGHYKKLEKKNL